MAVLLGLALMGCGDKTRTLQWTPLVCLEEAEQALYGVAESEMTDEG